MGVDWRLIREYKLSGVTILKQPEQIDVGFCEPDGCVVLTCTITQVGTMANVCIWCLSEQGITPLPGTTFEVCPKHHSHLQREVDAMSLKEIREAEKAKRGEL